MSEVTKMKIPEVSLVMPCYNEEISIRDTAPELINTFVQDGIDIEMILVNNGSKDGTEKIIDELIGNGFPITKVSLEKNEGYGGGILEGLKKCTSNIIGYLCADGQVSAEDTLMAFRLIKGREDQVITKVRRRLRQDSWKRKIVSILYNGMMQALFDRLGSIDINASPKFFSRRTFEQMNLVSRDWFLDPEIIIKAKYLGLRVIEVNVPGYLRKGGASNVNLGTCFEFIKNIVRYKYGKALEWKKDSDTLENLPADRDLGRLNKYSLPSQTDPMNGIRILPQRRHEDSRGFVQKVLTASQCNGNPPRGEVYVTSAKPGESKGNHYHLNMGEWFSVIQGKGEIKVCDPKFRKQQSIQLDASNPKTIYVPAGVAHVILNNSDKELICVAWAEKEHDPDDVYSINFRSEKTMEY